MCAAGLSSFIHTPVSDISDLAVTPTPQEEMITPEGTPFRLGLRAKATELPVLAVLDCRRIRKPTRIQ